MPFLSDSELDALLEQLAVLAGQPRQLEELSGGLTNRNVKITTPKETITGDDAARKMMHRPMRKPWTLS